MTRTNFTRFNRSLKHAGHGLAHAFTVEQNFRIHVAVGTAVAIVALALHISSSELAVLVLVIAQVLMLELVNTVVERFADILEPRVHPYVHIIKDLMAAAVVVSVVAAVLIGLVIFWPHIALWF